MSIRKLAAVAAAVMWLAWSGAASAQSWLRAESPNFVVYGTASEAKLREQALLLEDLDGLLRLMTGFSGKERGNKLRVYMVRGRGQLQIAGPRDRDVAGFYTSSPEMIAAFVDEQAQNGGNEVLFHEYAHHFMWQNAASAYPAWYIEGFAEYFSTAKFTPRHIEFGEGSRSHGYLLTQGRWLPMERVLFGSPWEFRGEDRARFYAQSWLLTHYLLRDNERREALRRYLTALARGGDVRGALAAELGMSPADLDKDLRDYIARRRLTMTRITRRSAEQPPEISVNRLPTAANDLLLLDAALQIKSAESEESGGLLQSVRAAAARHSGSSFAKRVLARAELLHGDRNRADTLLEELIAETPGDAELLYMRGMRYLMDARDADDPDPVSKKAQQWFARAHRADPNHFQTLFRYSEALRGEENYVSENTSNILLLAHQLAPQVYIIRMNAAQMLIMRGETDAGIALLEPLTSDTHNPGLAETARSLIARARSGGEKDGPGEADGGS
ncbi:MAG: hypothetical protein ACK4K7_11595 [Allosphingosinicella sp.]|uniref:hypothetical protein n=1 Tax=Allosphingosinicella sp. TaxID=2823234 RepID=UPI0039552222